jgi:putative photosynthetic complex assembly protein
MSLAALSRRVPAPGTVVAPDTFPSWVLWCAGGMIALSLLSVGLVRLTGNGPDQLRAAALAQGQPSSGAMAERSLRFEDRADGGISVIDARDGRIVAEIHGEQGFVRGSLRALTRERRARELGPEIPFELIAHADGRLTLLDPATGQRVNLESFGPTNAGNFARLLAQPSAPPGGR